MPDPLPSAIPAATLVIFRDAAGGGAPELLLVERAKAMAFAGGALVFPGGRVDPGDRTLAETLGGDADETAHRIAAVRETIEEVGLPIGIARPPTPAALATLRAALHGGAAFGEALAADGTALALDGLVPFARWRPAHPDMRIFDTRFYLAPLPAGAPDATVDRTENTRLTWATAAQVLGDADAGRATIIYPTRRNLERLALFGSFAEAAAHARAYPVRTITPVTEERDGRPHLCIPDDLGYPITAEPMRNAMRG
ncbi:NUDIX domain-containing protein [uncultured Sphingomonas sp.]|uniref:NUDIX hydrolase n=1 Tax=uncultured Sphingomonas sp. TaxID=158754 RepID=UPI0035CB1485